MAQLCRSSTVCGHERRPGNLHIGYPVFSFSSYIIPYRQLHLGPSDSFSGLVSSLLPSPPSAGLTAYVSTPYFANGTHRIISLHPESFVQHSVFSSLLSDASHAAPIIATARLARRRTCFHRAR